MIEFFFRILKALLRMPIPAQQEDDMYYDAAILRSEISRDEGRRELPYKDSLGIWTVGVGHNLEAHGLPVGMMAAIITRAGGLTDQEIDQLLATHMDMAERGLDRLFAPWRELSDVRQRVLLNMIFNLGESRFAGFKKFWAAMDAKNYPEAGLQMMDSVWARQVGVRAIRLRDMMLEG